MNPVFEGKRVAFHTLGCKLNFAETSTIARQMQEHGFSTVDFEKPADIYVINTCSVTDNADKKCRAVIRQALNTSPDAFIVIVGCYAQLKPAEIAEIPGVDVVLGAAEKFQLVHYLNDLIKKPQGEFHSCEIAAADSFVDGFSIGERTRSFLKVQDGCDYSCTFCTIPLARGKSRSDSIRNVVANAYKLGDSGINEIVLTGVNTGDFGKGMHGGKKREESFFELVQALDEVENIERFRISSIEPNLLHDEIISFVANSKRFMPHFHIPLQSGSDKILKLMKRRYLRELYESRVEYIKALMPHACIGVDVIVGFPGETEEDFLETYHFLNNLNISYLHVFTYSERENTLAADMEGAVPLNERRRRNKMLRTLSEKKRRFFYEENKNLVRPVLFEGADEDEYIKGFTDNYIRVKFPYDPEMINQLHQVRLRDIDNDGEMTILVEKELIQ